AMVVKQVMSAMRTVLRCVALAPGFMMAHKCFPFGTPDAVGTSDGYSVEDAILDPGADRFGVNVKFFGGFLNTHPLTSHVYQLLKGGRSRFSWDHYSAW